MALPEGFMESLPSSTELVSKGKNERAAAKKKLTGHPESKAARNQRNQGGNQKRILTETDWIEQKSRNFFFSSPSPNIQSSGNERDPFRQWMNILQVGAQENSRRKQ